VSGDVLGLVAESGLTVKSVLILLVAFSVISWTIIFARGLELRRASREAQAFLSAYHTESLESSFEVASRHNRCPQAAVFLATCEEMTRLAREGGHATPHDLNAAEHRALARLIRWTRQEQVQRLERGLPFLATVASSSPFIGLFGTVVGIINTFRGIGLAGNASLSVVGPGMAEALIATAVGLLAAIPASIAYNAFVTRVEDIGASTDLFAADLAEDFAQWAGAEGASGVIGDG
jgi:biopolymer transport protein TolQ